MTHSQQPASPDVSVIVICYNDADNLGRAVHSVLRQSLRNVEVIISDDGSTDHTPTVATALASGDPRVHYLRSESNSGGCGVPRNLGMEQARAPFVMFLDSDDELERHACYNLLGMARQENCEVVAGKCKRHYVATGAWTTWYPELFKERRVVTDVESEPELLFDSISTNKLYRKAFLERHELRFPERVKYEDLHFTAGMYARVERLGVIPETVYHWRIYPAEVRKTITHQRSTPQNVEDRFNAIETAADIFRSLGRQTLARELLVKLLRHDARITIEDAADTPDDAMRTGLFTRMEPHLRAVPPDLFGRLAVMERVALGMALLHDRDGVLQAKLWSRHKGAMAGRLHTRDGRVIWAPQGATRLPEPGTLEAALCDVTDAALLSTPTPVLRLAHVVTDAQVLDKGVRLTGVTHDPLLKFTGSSEPPHLELRIRLRRGAHTQVEPVRLDQVEPGLIRWSVDVTGFEERNNGKQARWWLSLRTTGDGRTNDSLLCRDDKLGKFSFPEPEGLTRRLRARIRLYTTAQGDLAFKRARLAGRAAAPGEILHKAHRARVLLRQAARRRHEVVRQWVYRGVRHLPVRRDLILFDSHMGTQYSDNPKAVYQELLRRDSDFEIVWDFRDPAVHGDPSMHRIKRHTIEYATTLARAGMIVDNQGLPAWATKRPDQFHLQTWHGTPLKRMALHKLEHIHPSADEVARITGEAAWDALISPSDYFEQTFVDSYRYRGHLIRGGTPRNDVLIKHPEPDPSFVRELDLPEGKKVVLYAPTFRENVRDRKQAAEVLLDLDRWVEEMGDTHYLLLRPHYLNRFAIKRTHAPYLMDVSKIDDISDLFRLSDVLVTDYSSVMFDYLWLERPIVIYAPDYESYAYDTRGTYFELNEDAPGPFCETQAALHGLVKNADQDAQQKLVQLRQFRDRYCGVEDGKASARVVDHLLAVRKGLV